MKNEVETKLIDILTPLRHTTKANSYKTVILLISIGLIATLFIFFHFNYDPKPYPMTVDSTAIDTSISSSSDTLIDTVSHNVGP